MKYVYIILILALLAGGYYVISSSIEKQQQAKAIPAGYHMMEDGTLMRNDMMGTEGMGAMAEMQDQLLETEAESDMSLSLEIDSQAQLFNVKGVNHVFDVKEMRVKEGDTVTINFESTEGFHDWVIDEFDAATAQVRPGTPTSVTFLADKSGTFEYYCSVGNHRAQGMVGTLIVE